MENPAIIISNISKHYKVRGFSGSRFSLGKSKTNSLKQVTALDNINLRILRGEMIGIMGPNGSGKSTLLKLISEVTPPSEGTIEVYGKVASILEVGIGFKPELTGTENVFLSAGLFGMRKSELSSKIDKITELFGFREFMNTPVKYYSSGMYMRLAFAVVIYIDADIYLFDEVLSVGDSSFKAQVLQILKKLKEQQKTILFVTHNPNELMNVVDKMLLLKNGLMQAFDLPEKVLVEEHKQSFTGKVNNVHYFEENETHNYQILDEELAKSIKPLHAKFLLEEGIVKISVLVKTCESTNTHKIVMLIKDNTTRPVAQATLIPVLGENSEESGFNIIYNESLFGPYTYYFDFFIMINNKPAYLLPQVLIHSFSGDSLQLGLIDLDAIQSHV